MHNSHLVKGHCVPCEGGTKPLDKKETATYLSLLKTSWDASSDGKSIKRQFKFKDFKEALDFINKVGMISESMNHHPEIINNYNKVHLKLKTHDKNQITELDHKMAKKVDDLFNI